MIEICRQFKSDFKSFCHRAKFVLSRFWYLNVKFSNIFYVHIIMNSSSFRINLNFANISSFRKDMIEICRQVQLDFISASHRAKFVLSRFWYLNVKFSNFFLCTYNYILFFVQNQFKFCKYLLRWVRYDRNM